MVWTEIQLDGRTDLHVFARGGITAARHRSDTCSLLPGHMQALLAMYSF